MWGQAWERSLLSHFQIFPWPTLNRFQDDLISIFLGSTKSLHRLWEEMNKIHPSVKFTMQHTTLPENKSNEDHCGCKISSSVPYLDTPLTIKKWTDNFRLIQKTNRQKHISTS